MSPPSASPAATDAASAGLIAGRRRAQLVENGVKAAAQRQLSYADVQALGANPSPEARATLAAKFGREYDNLLAGETRSLANAILELLVRDVEKKVRQVLADAVAASPNLPPATAARLARDDIDVARPVLEHSPVLSDDELAEIVRTHAMQYALAVAGREHLSEFLADVLTEIGDREVVTRLVGNHSACISNKTLNRIAQDYRAERAVQDRLIRRPELPYELVDQLVTLIGERLEWELVRDRRMSAEEARQLMTATRERATLSIVARDHGDRSVERELRQRFIAGELGPDDILAHLRDGEIGRVEAGLALLADLEVPKTRQLLYGMDKRGLAALCAKAGFAAPQYVALRMTLDLAEQGVKGKRDATYAPDTLRFIQEQFERVKADEELLTEWLDV